VCTAADGVAWVAGVADGDGDDVTSGVGETGTADGVASGDGSGVWDAATSDGSGVRDAGTEDGAAVGEGIGVGDVSAARTSLWLPARASAIGTSAAETVTTAIIAATVERRGWRGAPVVHRFAPARPKVGMLPRTIGSM
jgi:hypothetical protein